MIVYNNKNELILGLIEYVNCQRPADEINKDVKILEDNGYIVTGQWEWDLIFEHPDKGSKKAMLERHKEHMRYCKEVYPE